MSNDSTDVREIRIRLGNGFSFGFFVGLGFFASQFVVIAGVTLLGIGLSLSGVMSSLFQGGEGPRSDEPVFVPSATPIVAPGSAVPPPPSWSPSSPSAPPTIPSPVYSGELRPIPATPDTVTPEAPPTPSPYHSEPAVPNSTTPE